MITYRYAYIIMRHPRGRDEVAVLRADDVHIDEMVTAFKTQYALQDGNNNFPA